MPAPIVLLEPYNGGLSVARALVRAGVQVAVIAGHGDAFLAHIRGTDGRLLAFEGDGEARVAALEELAGHGYAGILTGADSASAWLAGAGDRLPPGLRTFEAQDGAHRPLMDKASADGIARRAGVTVPWTVPLSTPEELAAAAREATYPAVLKPVLSHEWRAVFGDHRVLLVHDAEDARRLGEPAIEAGQRLVLCDYVPGGDDHVEEAVVVRAPDGSYPVAFGCAKIRQFPVGFGAASLCEVADLPETMALARAVLDEADYVGVAGVEVKRHAATGRRYFLEVNVRIPTQFGLGDAAGLDSARRMAATLLGERLGSQPAQRRRARLLFPQQELRAVGAALAAAPRGRRLAQARRLARSYAGVRDFGILDLRDPVPGAALVAQSLARRVQR